MPQGLHWSRTTFGEPLITKPLSMELHKQLVKDYYRPFHDSIIKMSQQIISAHNKKIHSFIKKPDEKLKVKLQVFHLDLHSMPSVGTKSHPDPGEKRAEVVISDFHGRSSIPEFKEIVIKAYRQAGFQISYNKPYVGGESPGFMEIPPGDTTPSRWNSIDPSTWMR